MRTKLNEGEKLIIEVKKHWIVLVPSSIFLIFVGSCMLMVKIGYWHLGSMEKGLFNIFSYVFIVGVFYFMAAAGNRNVNIWAVTNFRVIDEWGLVIRNAKECPLHMINNVAYRQTVTGMFLNFGDVEIQTGNEKGDTINRYITSPKEFYNAVITSQNDLNKKVDNFVSSSQKECPYCFETIKIQATVCKHCRMEQPA